MASDPSTQEPLDRLRRQLRDAMLQALGDDDAETREEFIAQLEATAAQAADGEEHGSPWMRLALFLRACVALLRDQPYDRGALLPEDRAQLEAWEQGEGIAPAAAPQPEGALPESVVEALLAGDDAGLQAALAALPPNEQAVVLAEIERQMAAQVEALTPEQQAELRAQMQEQQIAGMVEQVQALAAHALREGDESVRRALAAQLAAEAARAAEGEDAGSPYAGLAAYLRAVAALLLGEPAPPAPEAFAQQIAALRFV